MNELKIKTSKASPTRLPPRHFQSQPSVLEVVVDGGGDGDIAMCRRVPSFFEIPISCWRALVLQRNKIMTLIPDID